MSEQPNEPDQPGSEDESQSAGTETRDRRPGAVRTEGETSVDDAIGTGDNVH
jgi:hypothetical protein